MADEANSCLEAVANHITTIEASEVLIEELNNKKDDVSAYDITQLQKNLTERFKSLKNVMEIFKNKELACSPKVLAQAVAVYDMSRMGKSIFAHNQFRRIVFSFSKYSRYQLTDLVGTYKKYTKDDMIIDVQNEIENTKIELPSGVFLDRTHKDYDPNLYKLSDAAITGTTSVIAGAARIWGFVSDQLKWRQGRLNQNAEAIAMARENLKPLDLVFETRTFTLSNYTIPGHWGHVGIWLGTKEELIELGIWNEEYFKPFRIFVEQGQNIVEIRKEGLNFQSIENFMNLDEFAISRVGGIKERAKAVYEELSLQIDKKYDFKFDSRSADLITCAELIAFSYGDIKWPETKTLFQYSLRPDDLALLTLDQKSPVNFVLYLKGSKSNQNQNMNFDEWKKLFKVKKAIDPEVEKAREEEIRWKEMYGA